MTLCAEALSGRDGPGLFQECIGGVETQHGGPGGVLDYREAQAFIEQLYARDGVALSLWDDRAKLPDELTPPFGQFMSYIEACVKA